jgi:gliding motility-associated-like protein
MNRLFNFCLLGILFILNNNNVKAQNASLCCPFIGWDYILPITITNNSGVATSANLQTLLVLNTQIPISQGKMQSNGNDIRFVFSTCGNFIDYYIESGINTSQTNIWIKMPAIPAGGSITVYLYYGNATATQGAVTFNNMFPNVLTLNAPTTLSGIQTYDWIDVQAGAAITMTAQQPLTLQARKIIFNGSFNGANLGYLPAAGPGAGGTDNGGSCGGGGGGYGGNGGSGGCGAGSGGIIYGTPNGTDIDMGSGGGGSDCPANGRGGGAISLLGCDIVFNGTVNVSGQTIANQCCCGNSSEAAGAGAGGGVRVIADYVSGNATITARGGNGQNSDDKEGGGGGGGGRVKVLYTIVNNFLGTANVAGGTRGSGGQSGQQDGAPGTFVQNQVQGLAISYAAEIPISLPLANFNFNNVCLNTLAAFTNASTVAPLGSITQWAWNFGDGVGTSNQQNPTYTFSTANTYTVSLTVTSVSGCTNTTTAQIAVNGNPTADFIAQNVCEGNASTFVDASTTVSQWAWNFGDGVGTSTQQNPTYNYTNAGNYIVTLIAGNNANCFDTILKPIVVQPSPTASYTVNFPNGNCTGNLFTFNDNTVAGSGINLTRFWSFGDGNTDIAQTVNYVYNTVNTFNTFLVATDQFGCRDTAFEDIVVLPSPIASFTVSQTCQNNPMLFNGDDASTALPLFYWNFGDGSPEEIDADTTTSHIYQNSGEYNVRLIVTGLANCSDTIIQTVTVNPNPQASFNVNNVCLGLPAQFSDASTVSQGTISSWAWSFGDGNNAPTQNASNTYNATGNYTITLLVQTDNGCVDSVQKQVSVFENPVFSFTTTAACFGESNGSATATPSNGAEPYSFSWQNGQATNTANNLLSGNYTVTVTDANGCTVSGTAIVGQPIAPLIISAIPDSFSIGFGDTVSFNITNNYYPEIQYSISPNYNLICNNCNSVFAYPNQTTTYQISASDSNGCSAQTEVTVTVTEKYVLYIPNVFTPDGNGTNDYVKVNARGVKTFYWVIFNRWGEKVFESNDINIAWDGTYKGKLLNSDVYVYKVQLSYITGKMVEQKGSISILK